MKTSAEEDEATLRSGKVSGRMRVAVEYRLRKKKILRRAVERYGGEVGPEMNDESRRVERRARATRGEG